MRVPSENDEDPSVTENLRVPVLEALLLPR